MSTGDLLRMLLSAYVERDDSMFRDAAEAVISDERAKNHRLLADDLERILHRRTLARAKPQAATPPPPIPVDRDRGLPLVRMHRAQIPWSRLILPEETIGELKRVVDEHRRVDVLREAGLAPTRRVLLYGPPGCGKTMAATVLASALDVPLAVVRFDSLVSSLLGETAANLSRVFGYLERIEAVVLFDEFDALGKERGDESEHGELKRVVSALLLQLDAFQGSSLIVAATNHERLLDTAIWRRFELVLRFPLPQRQDRILILRSHFSTRTIEETLVEYLAERTDGLAGSDLEMIALSAARRAALRFSRRIERPDVAAALQSHQRRSASTGEVD